VLADYDLDKIRNALMQTHPFEMRETAEDSLRAQALYQPMVHMRGALWRSHCKGGLWCFKGGV
jgi:hypothetical protein